MIKTKRSIHIISEGSKLVQREYKTTCDWLGKLIHWGLCKKFKCNHTNKWYLHKPESVLENEAPKILSQMTWPCNSQNLSLESILENETQKIISNFDIQTDQVIVNKKKKKKKRTCRIGYFTVLANHRVKLKESEKRNKYLDLAREPKKKTMEHRDNDTNCNKGAWYSHPKIGTGTRGLGN